MEEKLYLLVLKFLNFRPRSEKEVREYIKKKQIQYAERSWSSFSSRVKLESQDDNKNSLADLIIFKLKQQKFLDDKAFASWFMRSHTEFKPKGLQLIRQELRQKGIAEDMIDAVLADSEIRGESDKDLAAGLLFKKKRKYEYMEPRERFAKAGAMLARRGFDMATIKAAIDRVFSKVV